MTSVDAGANESPRARAQVEVEEVTPESAPTGPLTGDPTGLGLACFIMGAVALGLSLVGVVPARALGAPLAIILGATTVGLIITTLLGIIYYTTDNRFLLRNEQAALQAKSDRE